MGVVLVVDAVRVGVNAAVNFAIALCLFVTELRIGLDNGDFSCLDVHNTARYRCPINISTGIVLRAAVSKGALKAVTAFGSRQSSVNLGGAFLRLHIHRRENGIAATDDTTGQIVFQLADGHSTAKSHIGVGATTLCPRKTAGNLEVRAGSLIGNGGTHDSIVQHKRLNILFCSIVIHYARAVNVRAISLGGADAHACRHFKAHLGGRVGHHKCHRHICIPNQRIYIPIHTVHGESPANTHLGRGIIRFHGMLDIRAAQGNGAEEIRSRQGDSCHRCRSSSLIFHRHVIQHGIRPAAQEGQGYTALDADGSPGTLLGTGSGSCSLIILIVSPIRVSRPAGFPHGSGCIRGSTLILGCHLMVLPRLLRVLQILGVGLGFISSLRTLLGPLCPFLRVLPGVFVPVI